MLFKEITTNHFKNKHKHTFPFQQARQKKIKVVTVLLRLKHKTKKIETLKQVLFEAFQYNWFDKKIFHSE